VLISTDVWAGALIRRAGADGAFATVVRKGDPTAGAVLVKVMNQSDKTFILYASATRGDGETVWMQPTAGAESELDAYIDRARSRDPDLWVIEIEDQRGRHFLTEPVE